MKTSNSKVLSVIGALIAVTTSVAAQHGSGAATQITGRSTPAFARLPLSFEVNQGQAGAQTKFISRGRRSTLLLTGDGAVLSLRTASTRGSNVSALRSQLGMLGSTARPSSSESVSMTLLGASRAASVDGLDELPGRSNYFIGKDRRKWHVNVPNYSKVKYDDIYPGIDLVYYGNEQQLEYDFIVAPGADPRAIRLELKTGSSKQDHQTSKGASVGVDASGDLVIRTASGEVRFLKPVLYQASSPADRQLVDGGFVMLAENRVGFNVGAYDRTRPLVIDPVLSYSTYLGGSENDEASGIALDAFGNAYVSGFTCASFETDCDVTVTKINSTGTAKLYSTVLGGSGDDRASLIAVGVFGDAYLTGRTCSPDFPTTTGAFQTTLGGGCDAFVTKLDSNGGQVYSTYLGGAEVNATGEDGLGIAVDSEGHAYVSGSTCTSDFPTKNGFRRTQGHCDGFAAKLNPAGGGAADLLYSTLLGGDDGVDGATGIAVDASNFVYVTGFTTGDDFPTTDGAYQTSNAGFGDAVIVKLDMTKSGSSSLLYSTYLGGRFSDGTDSLAAIAVDSDGIVYVSGTTDSANFPTTPGAFQPTRNPDTKDASFAVFSGFVTKLNPAGHGDDDLLYSTFIGGNSSETHPRQGEKAFAVAVRPSGNIYVAGGTCSKDFPVTSDGFQKSFAGPVFGSSCDAFLLKLNPAGGGQSDLVYSTYLGGNDVDAAFAIALDAFGNAHVSGSTLSHDFPHTPDALQTTIGAGASFDSDGFVATIPIGEFSLEPVAAISADVGGSGTSSATINSIDEFIGPVTMTVSGATGVAAAFNPDPVTLPAGSSASSAITVKPGLATTPGTFSLTVTGTSGLLTHSVPTQLTVRASSGGTSTVIDDLTAIGCIDNSGISGALINKLAQAQADIDAGKTQDAINILSALLNQLQAQSGKHIVTSCTVDGQTFNPVEVLIADVRAILASLKVAATANLITGYVVNESNLGVAGVTVTLPSTASTATTDSTGFYFFADTRELSSGGTYAAQVSGVPSGYDGSTLPTRSFTWQGRTMTLASLALVRK